VCQRLKQEMATARIPVIVVTAVGQITAKEAASQSGADDFVTKPVQPADLRVRVQAHAQGAADPAGIGSHPRLSARARE